MPEYIVFDDPKWLDHREQTLFGSSPTRNKEFDENGFVFLKNLIDVEETGLVEFPPPPERGMFKYADPDPGTLVTGGLMDMDIEPQVMGSLSRYKLPIYRSLQNKLKPKLEKIIGKKLMPSFNYDRFYFPGQQLPYHLDRFACEISISMLISTNLDQSQHPWPLWIKKPPEWNENGLLVQEGKHVAVTFSEPGDAVLYKGCERPHYREPMPSKYTKWEKKLMKFLRREDDTYYHQVFIHYVLESGEFIHLTQDYVRSDYWGRKEEWK